MTDFRMPSLGADMEEATLLEWLVKPGDVVHRGDVVATVDTVKTAMDVEVFEDGTVERLLAEPGTVLPVGAPMAVIRSEAGVEAGALAPEPPAAASAPPAPTPPHAPSPLTRRRSHAGARTAAPPTATPPVAPPAAAPTAAPDGQGVRAVPRARRRAAELGLDLTGIPGTGPAGAVTAEDVERAAGPAAAAAPTASAAAAAPGASAAPARAPVGAPSSTQRLAAMQAAVGTLMARSKREVPHYYLSSTIDMGAALDWLAERNSQRSVTERLVPAALLLKATALAARRVPEVNGFWTEAGFAPSAAVHLGVAISLRGGGLMAPGISDADQAGVEDLMKALRDLVSRARAGRLRQSEMASPTITVTNLGDLGVEQVYGVIYPPQVALVGFGRIADRPVAVDRMLAIRPVVTATLCGDHRVSDGHRGARFLSSIESLLQHPEEL